MDADQIAILTVTSFFTSMITSVAGAGGGAILLAVLLQFMPPSAAIPFHGSVQFAANVWRFWLFRKHMDWPIIIRFSILMPFGIAFGVWLFRGMPAVLVQISIGMFIYATLAGRYVRPMRTELLPLWTFVPIGFIAGAMNIVVGIFGPVVGALIVKRGLPKESVVGTMSVFGFLSNFLKVVGFTYVGFSIFEYGPALLIMTPAVLIGTSLGKVVLGRFSEEMFRKVFQALLLIMATKLVFYDGISWLVNNG
ncbi:MAG: sulfite exporter TauE/SafE family protein [Alphaproteobacteria bacterium]